MLPEEDEELDVGGALESFAVPESFAGEPASFVTAGSVITSAFCSGSGELVSCCSVRSPAGEVAQATTRAAKDRVREAIKAERRITKTLQKTFLDWQLFAFARRAQDSHSVLGCRVLVDQIVKLVTHAEAQSTSSQELSATRSVRAQGGARTELGTALEVHRVVVKRGHLAQRKSRPRTTELTSSDP